LVVAWSGDTYPPVAGLVVRAGQRSVWVPVEAVAEVAADRLVVSGPLPAQAADRPPGLVALAHDVLDRQLVDVDDLDVTRVSDLVVAPVAGGLGLVGADVNLPSRPSPCTTPALADSTLRLTAAAREMRALSPRDVAAVLADLPAAPRETLSAAIKPGRAR
jgi:hypothetical protein